MVLDHACAVVANGGVKCWGDNGSAQLGTLDTRTVVGATSVQMLPGPAVSVGVAESSSCAILTDGRLACWGTDSTVIPPSATPVVIPLDAGAWHVEGGLFVNCAITGPSRSVYCWGSNALGAAVGNGMTSGAVSVPTLVSLDAGAVKLAGGSKHECALLVDGRVMCWGYNFYGQLGDQTSVNRSTPVQFKLDAGAIDVSASRDATCVLRTNGTTVCVGDANFDFTTMPNARKLAVAGRTALLGIDSSDRVLCRPGFSSGLACAQMTTGSPVILDAGAVEEVHATDFTACAVQGDAGVLCWGNNALGVVGLPLDAGLVYRFVRPLGL